MPQLLLATNNPGKVREFLRLLQDIPFEIVTPDDMNLYLEVEETGTTYEENATLKAKAFAAAGNCWALADDSGIEVDALDGAPGVFSARYGAPGLDDAGRTNHLLFQLQDATDEQRTARYRAVVAVATPEGEVHLFSGTQQGRVAREWRGDRGFGYDPVFIVDGDGRTNAELSDEEKDAISHRGQAVRAAAAFLREGEG